MSYSLSSILMQALISMHTFSVILNAVLEHFETLLLDLFGVNVLIR